MRHENTQLPAKPGGILCNTHHIIYDMKTCRLKNDFFKKLRSKLCDTSSIFWHTSTKIGGNFCKILEMSR
jgi:hypothetical protein